MHTAIQRAPALRTGTSRQPTTRPGSHGLMLHTANVVNYGKLDGATPPHGIYDGTLRAPTSEAYTIKSCNYHQLMLKICQPL